MEGRSSQQHVPPLHQVVKCVYRNLLVYAPDPEVDQVKRDLLHYQSDSPDVVFEAMCHLMCSTFTRGVVLWKDLSSALMYVCEQSSRTLDNAEEVRALLSRTCDMDADGCAHVSRIRRLLGMLKATPLWRMLRTLSCRLDDVRYVHRIPPEADIFVKCILPCIPAGRAKECIKNLWGLAGTGSDRDDMPAVRLWVALHEEVAEYAPSYRETEIALQAFYSTKSTIVADGWKAVTHAVDRSLEAVCGTQASDALTRRPLHVRDVFAYQTMLEAYVQVPSSATITKSLEQYQDVVEDDSKRTTWTISPVLFYVRYVHRTHYGASDAQPSVPPHPSICVLSAARHMYQAHASLALPLQVARQHMHMDVLLHWILQAVQDDTPELLPWGALNLLVSAFEFACNNVAVVTFSPSAEKGSAPEVLGGSGPLADILRALQVHPCVMFGPKRIPVHTYVRGLADLGSPQGSTGDVFGGSAGFGVSLQLMFRLAAAVLGVLHNQHLNTPGWHQGFSGLPEVKDMLGFVETTLDRLSTTHGEIFSLVEVQDDEEDAVEALPQALGDAGDDDEEESLEDVDVFNMPTRERHDANPHGALTTAAASIGGYDGGGAYAAAAGPGGDGGASTETAIANLQTGLERSARGVAELHELQNALAYYDAAAVRHVFRTTAVLDRCLVPFHEAITQVIEKVLAYTPAAPPGVAASRASGVLLEYIHAHNNNVQEELDKHLACMPSVAVNACARATALAAVHSRLYSDHTRAMFVDRMCTLWGQLAADVDRMSPERAGNYHVHHMKVPPGSDKLILVVDKWQAHVDEDAVCGMLESMQGSSYMLPVLVGLLACPVLHDVLFAHGSRALETWLRVFATMRMDSMLPDTGKSTPWVTSKGRQSTKGGLKEIVRRGYVAPGLFSHIMCNGLMLELLQAMGSDAMKVACAVAAFGYNSHVVVRDLALVLTELRGCSTPQTRKEVMDAYRNAYGPPLRGSDLLEGVLAAPIAIKYM